MDCANSAASRARAAPDSSDDLQPLIGRYLPSWLTSLVVHLSLVLVMALLVVGDGSWGGNGISLAIQGGSDSGADGQGQLDDAIATSSELSNDAQLQPPTTPIEALEQRPIELPPIELAGLPVGDAGQSATTGDDGNGHGNGSGDGDGDGDASEDGTGIGIGPIRTEVFGLAAEGADFVYVFDRSESMNSVLSYSSEGTTVFSITPLDAAKAELLRSLEDLQRGHRFGIVFYNHDAWMFTLGSKSKGLVRATPDNKRRAAAFVASMYGQGQTHHIKPLEIALRMRPDTIFLLTDGEAKDDPTPHELDHLRKLNGGRTKINVVQFCYKLPSGGALVQLAEENGGQHLFFNLARLGPGLPGGGSRPGR